MKTTLKNFILVLSLLSFFLVSFFYFSFAAQVSQTQIEQLKRLPASEQQALAKSMGVDLNMIKGQLSTGQPSEINEVTPVYSRDTQFEHSVHKAPTLLV